VSPDRFLGSGIRSGPEIATRGGRNGPVTGPFFGLWHQERAENCTGCCAPRAYACTGSSIGYARQAARLALLPGFPSIFVHPFLPFLAVARVLVAVGRLSRYHTIHLICY